MLKSKVVKSGKIFSLFVFSILSACAANTSLVTPISDNISAFSDQEILKVSDSNFQSYFSNTYEGNSDIARHSENNPDKQFIKILNEAKKSVDICAFSIDSDNITAAIINAKKRGLQVRVVVDSDTNKRTSLQKIRAADIPVTDDGGRSALMHNKFAIIDETIVWTGSFNFTDSASWMHCDNAIKISNKYLAMNYTYEFEKMFVNKKFGRNKRANLLFPNSVKYRTLKIGNKTVKTFFAPVDDVSSALIAEIGKATKEIKFMSYSFTHEAIADALVKQANKGVKVSGIFEHIGSGSGKDSSIYSKLSRAKANLFVYKNANQAQALMHHKVVIIDGKTVTTGSFNFTYNASNDNDENMLVISSPDVAESYRQEFSRIQEKCSAQNIDDASNSHVIADE